MSTAILQIPIYTTSYTFPISPTQIILVPRAFTPPITSKDMGGGTPTHSKNTQQRAEEVSKGPGSPGSLHQVPDQMFWQQCPASPDVSFDITALTLSSSCELSKLQLGFPLKHICLQVGWEGDQLLLFPLVFSVPS